MLWAIRASFVIDIEQFRASGSPLREGGGFSGMWILTGFFSHPVVLILLASVGGGAYYLFFRSPSSSTTSFDSSDSAAGGGAETVTATKHLSSAADSSSADVPASTGAKSSPSSSAASEHSSSTAASSADSSDPSPPGEATSSPEGYNLSSLKDQGITAFLGNNSGGIASWYRTNSGQDSTNGAWPFRSAERHLLTCLFFPSLALLQAVHGASFPVREHILSLSYELRRHQLQLLNHLSRRCSLVLFFLTVSSLTFLSSSLSLFSSLLPTLV